MRNILGNQSPEWSPIESPRECSVQYRIASHFKRRTPSKANDTRRCYVFDVCELEWRGDDENCHLHRGRSVNIESLFCAFLMSSFCFLLVCCIIFGTLFLKTKKKMNSRSLSHFRLIEKINKIWKHNWKIYKTSFHFIFYYFSLSVALCGRSRSLGVFLFFALSHVTIHNRIVVDGWTHQRDSFVILLTFITFLKKSHLTILSSHFLLGFFFVSNNRQHQWYFLMTKNAIN